MDGDDNAKAVYSDINSGSVRCTYANPMDTVIPKKRKALSWTVPMDTCPPDEASLSAARRDATEPGDH
ncbi:hypothetical protein [Streptomyces sp. NRRL S-1022]|uniref:hypothetical protein n=1 Tax=Streptomyces sp. NRRL S-1022 TaxID=1463880 RepID=UPI00131DD43D|nr:hypothetical protein [Streptomyces sp. NRRL S-1022]